jgi:hypothetical protein
MFKAGYRFPNAMTYNELCEFVSQESNKAGFDPLRPKLNSKARPLDYVTFYCVHGRDHKDQSRAARGQAPSASSRPVRAEENTRCLFTRCDFEMRVVRSNEDQFDSKMSLEELKIIKENHKVEWYVDSPDDQKKKEDTVSKIAIVSFIQDIYVKHTLWLM